MNKVGAENETVAAGDGCGQLRQWVPHTAKNGQEIVMLQLFSGHRRELGARGNQTVRNDVSTTLYNHTGRRDKT